MRRQVTAKLLRQAAGLKGGYCSFHVAFSSEAPWECSAQPAAGLFVWVLAVLMYAASLPFALTFASIAAFTSGIFLLVARVAGALRGAPKVVVRLLGAVAAMMALIWIRTAIVSTGHE